MHIPSPDELNRNQAAQSHAKNVESLTSELVKSLANYHGSKVYVCTNLPYTDQVIDEVIRNFHQRGWIVVKTGAARSGVFIEITRL
jgi:hypothetical protein